MHDEPGAADRFSRKMSLRARSAMLGIDRQLGNEPGAKPGADPGVFAGQRCSRFQSEKSRRGLRVGKPDAGGAGILGLGPREPGADPAVRREDDWIEPGPGDSADWAIPARRAGAGESRSEERRVGKECRSRWS